MGWLFYERAPGETNAEHFTRELLGTTGEYGEFLATATVANVFYAAWRKPDGNVVALVVLTKRAGREFGYKAMDETMGPNEARCPKSILDALSPTEYEYAAEWRRRCHANLATAATAAKVKKGDRIRFAEPLRFNDGRTRQTFRFIERSTFADDETGTVVRVTSWRTRAWAFA